MDLITRYCRKALLLEEGRIIASGSAKDVVDEYNRRVVGGGRAENRGDQESDEENGDTADVASTPVKALQGTQAAYTLNSNENRYGSGEAEILDAGINAARQ